MENLAAVMIVVAVICTLISVITEFTKQIGILNKIPTSLQVLVTSIVVCQIALFAYTSYAKIHVVWYYPVAVFFAAFVIAIICTNGWDYLLGIWKRFYNKDNNSK